jgi:hypothetical protein
MAVLYLLLGGQGPAASEGDGYEESREDQA